MHKSAVNTLTAIFVLLMMQAHVYADSPADLVSKGNAAYLSGKYDEAISAYDEASVEAPESPYIYFNRGAALYKKGDYSGATEAFEKAALKSRDPQLEAKSKFNLGNCAFREAERQQDSDLKKALEACSKSIRHYQESLELDPGSNEAAENIEVVRLMMKTILDEINKQKEAAKQQQQMVDQLKALIEKQQNALDRNRKIEDERSRKGDSNDLREKIQDLARDQNDLQVETEDLAKKMPKTNSQNAPAAENPAEKHLKNASKEQKAASGNLEQNHMSAAGNNQEKALKELKDALASLEKDQGGGGQKQQQQQEGEQQAKQQQASPSGESPPSQDKKRQEEDQSAVAQLPDDAHDILDEEKENQKQRRMRNATGYRDVDKDW